MMQLQLQGNDMSEMYALYEALSQDITQAGLGDDLVVSEPAEPYEETAFRGDAATLITVAVAAVSAGGALTALLGKDGFLSSLAGVLSKYVETRKADLMIEKEGEKIQIKGTAKEIQAILESLKT